MLPDYRGGAAQCIDVGQEIESELREADRLLEVDHVRHIPKLDDACPANGGGQVSLGGDAAGLVHVPDHDERRDANLVETLCCRRHEARRRARPGLFGARLSGRTGTRRNRRLDHELSAQERRH